MALQQVGALPFRVSPDGSGIELLLVTSRRTGRWIVPKGNIDSGRDKRTMAATEAFEEAGVRGALLDRSIGWFGYDKVFADGRCEDAEVELFALSVTEVLDDWPEKGQRDRQWFSPAEAAERIEEVELAALLLVFGALPPDGVRPC